MDSTKLLKLLKEASLDRIELGSKGGSVTVGTKNTNVKVDVDFSKTTKAVSIKNQAKKSIAQFPVLVSETLNPALAPILLNAIETKNALYLSMLIQNTRSFNTDNVSGVIGSFIKESAETAEAVFLQGCETVNELTEASRDLLKPYDEVFNKTTLNETYYSKSLKYFLEAQNSEDRANESQKWKREDRKRQQEKDELEKEDRAREKAERNAKNGVNNVLTQPKDLLKQNDLQPLVLKVEVNFTDPSTNAVITRDIMIGVKSVGHLVKQKDIVYYLVKSAYKNNFFLKLIKWTTGEISFFKDLLFTLDDIKADVRIAAGSNNNNPFYQLAQKAKAAKGVGLAGEKCPTQITTLIITKADVEAIKYKDGINILTNPEYLKKILHAYHLMDIYIVDESLDMVYAYNDQTHNIDRLPFSSFEKQSKERKVSANDLYKLFK